MNDRENKNNQYELTPNKNKIHIQNFFNKSYSKAVNIYKILKQSNKEKNELQKNVEFKNKYIGERCFIIANGPSIKSVDLKKLENEITFTVNQMPRLAEFKNIKTNYHIWSDPRFFKNDNEIIDIMKRTNISSSPICFYPYIAREFINETKLDSFLNIRYFNGIGGPLYNGYKKKIDYTKVSPHFPTVVDYGITLAIYMGFKEIYLLGCDCTGFVNLANLSKSENTDNLEYGYEIDEKERNRLKNALLAGKNIRFELNNYAKLFEDYEILNEYCRKRNIKLINCTEGGLLYSIERKTLDEVLKDEKN